MTTHFPDIAFDNSYARDLEGFYVTWQGDDVPDPQVLRLNAKLAVELGLDVLALQSSQGAAILAGSHRAAGSEPLAMAYAGHQFGGFSPQLGDGRALLLGEIVDPSGARRDIHLKGSGRTPFSRGADGKAVLGPVLREYLIGEAMHALGIPTTRALAAITTGENINRDGMAKQGAVLARVASSHLRVGTFQFFAARNETDNLRQLADYAIARHWPELATHSNPYLSLLTQVIHAQARLVAKWMNVGFVHGVMNTDNMTISGETIDYGPCAFLDRYDAKAVFSSIDSGGRYAFANQPAIAQWNLARFAETLLPLTNPEDADDAVRQATNEINTFPAIYQTAWLDGLRQKLGLGKETDGDLDLANELLTAMDGQNVDFTNLFRSLADVVRDDFHSTTALFDDAEAIENWLARYARRAAQEERSPDDLAGDILSSNPVYIPRNHKVEEALTAAETGDMAPFDGLLDAVTMPFMAQAGLESYAIAAPSEFGPYRTFCGT